MHRPDDKRSRREGRRGLFFFWARTREEPMHMRGSLRTELFGGLVDRKVSLLRIEARDSSIVTKWRITGRNDRGIPQLDIPPNGRTLDVEAITVDGLVDGIPRRFSIVDLTRVIDQLASEDVRAAS
jgi:hypothetical protein